ncbi:MAG: PfkB family carbohydrate kinase [Trueperaceae bacterium]|nr:PfkB family carbohydrate kinase [Trueperaceae bacterium]
MSGLLVVGGANLDQVARAPRLPGRGETILATGYHESPGGKAANLASAAAAWGAPVRFVGRVGEDGFGDVLLEAWREAGVDVRHVRRDPAGTGLGIVFMDDAGQYQTIVVPRANARLAARDVAELPADAWDGVAVVALALEAPAEATLAAARAAAERGLPLVLNAAPAEGMTADLWPFVTHLIVNEHEAALLSGRAVSDREGAIAAGTALVDRLAAGRAAAVVVTLGAEGAVLLAAGVAPAHVPAPVVAARDTLGAGDTFVGVFAAEVAAGRPLARAAARACVAGAIAVTVAGARAAVRPADLETLAASDPVARAAASSAPDRAAPTPSLGGRA